MNVQAFLTEFTGGRLREIFAGSTEETLKNAVEIRLRTDKPLIIKKTDGEFFMRENGLLCGDYKKGYAVCAKDIAGCIEIMSNYSLYAFADEIKNGYITLPGGHRVGVCGRAVVENGHIKTLKNINGLNIRITHEIIGCAERVMKYILSPGAVHTMLISPPGCGKTTLLRDIIRILSGGNGKPGGITVGVADERSEIAGSFLGVAQNDVGIRTDILDGCPKAEGMIMLLRSMSPDVIAVDEIGRREDMQAIEDIMNAGITLICAVHGSGIEDVLQKPVLSEIIEKKVFERYVILSNKGGVGRIEAIYNKDFRNIYRGDD